MTDANHMCVYLWITYSWDHNVKGILGSPGPVSAGRQQGLGAPHLSRAHPSSESSSVVTDEEIRNRFVSS